jgi:hypothetical protein
VYVIGNPFDGLIGASLSFLNLKKKKGIKTESKIHQKKKLKSNQTDFDNTGPAYIITLYY